MATSISADDFEGADFVRTNFTHASFTRSTFAQATIRFSDLTGLTIRECDVAELEIDSHDLFFGSLYVNGVDVVPLVDAELNRQFPGRELSRSTTPAGLYESWEAAQAAWNHTVTHTSPELRQASVRDEWSLAQTLRHLVFATDAWLRLAIQEMTQPFHPIGLPFTGAADMGFDTAKLREPVDFNEILAVRHDRQHMVSEFLATVTPEYLDEVRSNPWDPTGQWKPTVGDCLRTILEEEWAHLRYIRRDLATAQDTATLQD